MKVNHLRYFPLQSEGERKVRLERFGVFIFCACAKIYDGPNEILLIEFSVILSIERQAWQGESRTLFAFGWPDMTDIRFTRNSFFRLKGRWIRLPNPHLACKWIHLVDPLVALPSIHIYQNLFEVF